jgi:hypothetical protein
MGLGCIRDEYVPAMKWCFDRVCGLKGMQHFDCTYPYQAAYAVKNYPFEVAEKTPNEGLPLVILDRTHGEFLFRNRWKDADDIVAVLNLNLSSIPGLGREAASRVGTLAISGLGTNLLNGRMGLPLLNQAYGAELLYAETGKKGQASLGARMDRMYERASRRRRWSRRQRFKTTDVVIFPPPRLPATEPTGIECTRHFAVDYSGAAGVPGLFVVIDELTNAGDQRWLFPASRKRGQPGTVLGDPAGRNLTWQFVGGEEARRGYVQPGDRCFAIVTVNNGPAPKAAAATEGDTTRVKIGGQTVTYDGKRIRFAR